MILSTPSYGGGSDLWDEARAAPLRASTKHFQSARPARRCAMDDGLLEVVGVTDVLHLAASLGGLSSGVRLCQGRQVTIDVPKGGVPLQVDGEPYNVAPASDQPGGLEPFSVELKREGQALMLARGAGRAASGRRSAYAAVEKQLSRRGLSTSQRDELLWALAGAEAGRVAHAGTREEDDEEEPEGEDGGGEAAAAAAGDEEDAEAGALEAAN